MYIFSFNPIDIDGNMYDYIGSKYNVNVINYYSNAEPSERVECGYDEEFEFFKRVRISEKDAISMLKGMSNEIIIFFGVLYQMNLNLLYLLKRHKNNNHVFIISERYNAFGNFWQKRIKEIIRYFDFRIIAFRAGECVDAFFAYGDKGVRYFKGCGFKNIYPLIYATNYSLESKISKKKTYLSGNIIRFVYVGRLEFDLKGVDILLKALDELLRDNIENWHIDFIGGYGKDSKKVEQWVQKNKDYSTIVGRVPANQVIKTLSEYDICVIPSRKEGFHTLPAQCIAAEIGCIVTDECVSDEIVQKYNTGIVVRSKSVSALYYAMLSCIQEKELINKYLYNTRVAKSDLEMEKIATYLWETICMNIQS